VLVATIAALCDQMSACRYPATCVKDRAHFNFWTILLLASLAAKLLANAAIAASRLVS
jgi:hypothetical protein